MRSLLPAVVAAAVTTGVVAARRRRAGAPVLAPPPVPAQRESGLDALGLLVEDLPVGDHAARDERLCAALEQLAQSQPWVLTRSVAVRPRAASNATSAAVSA